MQIPRTQTLYCGVGKGKLSIVVPIIMGEIKNMSVLTTKEEYIETLDEIGQKWLREFLDYMDQKYPNLTFVMFRSRPMYKVGKSYVLFSVAKTHFTVHALDFDLIGEMKNILPNADFGKGCVKVKFKHDDAKPELKALCDRIVERNQLK